MKVDLGFTTYSEFQELVNYEITLSDMKDQVWTFRVPSIITQGTQSRKIYKNSTPVIRAGGAAFHDEGQAIVVVLIPYRKKKISPKLIIRIVQEVVISLLEEKGIIGYTIDHPGVYVDGRQICAIAGNSNMQNIAYGISLNVKIDESKYNHIDLCDISNMKPTQTSLYCSETVDYWEYVISETLCDKINKLNTMNSTTLESIR